MRTTAVLGIALVASFVAAYAGPIVFAYMRNK